jgi:hypothetical protein
MDRELAVLCAIVNNNVVTSIKTLDPTDGSGAYQSAVNSCQNVVDISNIFPSPQVGWTLNGSQLVSNGVTSSIITKLAFRQRFTMPELIGILAAISAGGTEGYILQVMQENLSVATFIDLSRSDTQAAVQQLVSFGLLTQARATQILTTPPAASEIPVGITT